MVIKGNARGGAAKLTAHLMRTDTNERAELVELRGVAAHDLAGALLEMEAVATGARSNRHFYHASINTRADEVMTAEQRTMAIDRLADALGLADQPRAVMLHEKEGRQHFHIVWSRIEPERLTAISDSHNYRRHEEVARELEREFGHERVQGAHVERDGERPERTPSHAEMMQAERTGLTPQQAKAQITDLWRTTDSGQAFAAALEDQGWILARGDKRGFVVVDPAGEPHSLARRVDGVTAKDVRERMADVDLASLPSAADARVQQQAREPTPLAAPVVEAQPEPQPNLAPQVMALPEVRAPEPGPEVETDFEAVELLPPPADLTPIPTPTVVVTRHVHTEHHHHHEAVGEVGELFGSLLHGALGHFALDALIDHAVGAAAESSLQAGEIAATIGEGIKTVAEIREVVEIVHEVLVPKNLKQVSAPHLGLHVAVDGPAMALTEFATQTISTSGPPPRKYSPVEIMTDPAAMKAHLLEQKAGDDRAAALDRIAADISKDHRIAAHDVASLSMVDLEGIKSRGDAYLLELIRQREREQERKRERGREL